MDTDPAAVLHDVRAAKKLILDATVDAFRSLLDKQYPSIRGFAMLAEKPQVEVSCTLRFDFAAKTVGVQLSTVPPPIIETVRQTYG